MMSHPQPYTIGSLRQGDKACVSINNAACNMTLIPLKMRYYVMLVCLMFVMFCQDDHIRGSILLFTNIGPRPYCVIVTLGDQLYRIPKVVVPTTAVSLITTKQCRKISSQRDIFYLHGFIGRSIENHCDSQGLCKGFLYTVETGRQVGGRIQRHLHLTYKHTFAQSGKTCNWF